MLTPIKVEIVKSDVMYGRKIEHIHEFCDIDTAKQFVINFNSVNDPDNIVDHYSFARLVDRRITNDECNLFG